MTLLEVLIAMSILAFMLMMVWYTTSSSVEAKNEVEAIQEREHELRIALSRMVKDIQVAYLSDAEIKNIENRRTLFVGKDSRPVDELRFSSLAHRVLWAESNESEQTWISYAAADDPEDRSKTNLIRRESRRLSNEPWESEPGEVDVLLRDIERVEFEYFNWRDNEWQETWDSTKTDGERDQVPERVRITITMERDDKTIKRTTQVRLFLMDPLEL